MFVFLLAFFIFVLSWRAFSKRHHLPCPSWLSWIVEIDNPFAKAHKSQEIIKSIEFFEGIKILDMGCGPGRILLPLAQKTMSMHGHVTGLDIQEEMIHKTATKAQDLKITNVDFVCGDIYKITSEKTYDVVIMSCVLGEIPEKEHSKMLHQISNVLASRGILSITETIFDPHFQSHKKVRFLMEKAGFIEVKFMGNCLAYTAHFKKKI